MKVFVYIATTQGPVLIRKISEEDDDVESVVCLNHTSQQLPITNNYRDFVKKGQGVIHRDFGHCAFRLDLGGDVTSGDSWQLPVYLAHVMKARGVLLDLASNQNEQFTAADLVIWASGTVAVDHLVSRVESIENKLSQSRQFFSNCETANTTLIVVLPKDNGDNATLNQIDGMLSNCNSEIVLTQNVQEAINRIDAKLPRGYRLAASAFWNALILGGLAIIATAVFFGIRDSEPSQPVRELDDFGSSSAEPNFSESTPQERISVPPEAQMPDRIKLPMTSVSLQAVHSKEDQGCGNSSNGVKSQTIAFSSASKLSIDLKNLCKYGVKLDSNEYTLIAVAPDIAKRITVTIDEEASMQWIDLPTDRRRNRSLMLIVLPSDEAKPYNNRLDTELRRLRCADHMNLTEHVEKSLDSLTFGYLGASLVLNSDKDGSGT